jgi:hypothetical protein
MSFFTQPQRVVQIDEDNSITIRALTYGETQDLTSRCMTLSADVGRGSTQAVAQLDGPLMEQLTWEKAIIAWSGPGFEGRPVTRENILGLPTFIFELLKKPFDEISELGENEKNA